MNLDEELRALLATAQEHTKQLTEHTKHLEMDGLFIRQLAQLAAETHEEIGKLALATAETHEKIGKLAQATAEGREDIKRMTNAMEALIELNANHETRLNRLEDNK